MDDKNPSEPEVSASPLRLAAGSRRGILKTAAACRANCTAARAAEPVEAVADHLLWRPQHHENRCGCVPANVVKAPHPLLR